MGKFNIYKSTRGYYFTLTNKSGNEVMKSGFYTRKHDAKRGIDSTINAITSGRIFNNTRGTRYSFTVRGKNKTILSKSRNWNRPSDVTRAVRSISDGIACTEVIDKTK